MKAAAQLALDAASVRGVTYADARVVSIRNRSLTTKNGRVGHASESESLGIGVRVIAEGAWGFAASADLSRAAVEAAAARAVEIARASARVKREDVRLAPEPAAVAEWTTPYKVDPFTTSVEQNLDLLLKVDAEMRAVAGVTLAETGMNFQREESWFLSSEGSRHPSDKIFDRRRIYGVCVCRFRDSEAILSELLRRAMAEPRLRTDRRNEIGGECPAGGGRSRRLASCASSARKAAHNYSGRLATGLADSRIHRASD